MNTLVDRRPSPAVAHGFGPPMRPDRNKKLRLWVLLELQGKDKLARATSGAVSLGRTIGGTQGAD